MSTTKFTPGPWKIVETVYPSMVPYYHIKIGDDQISIFPYKRSYSEDGIQSGLIFDREKIANANLIAAAPDLYRELELARFTIAMEIATMGPRTLDREEKEALIAEHPAIKLIDAALKKARGE